MSAQVQTRFQPARNTVARSRPAASTAQPVVTPYAGNTKSGYHPDGVLFITRLIRAAMGRGF